MCGLVRFTKDQQNGTPNIFVEPMYIAWSGSLISTLAGGSGGLERNALLAISLLISSCSFTKVMNHILIQTI